MLSEESAKVLAQEAKKHETLLTGFSSLGYTLPGYGASKMNEDGVPVLHKAIADLEASKGTLARTRGVHWVDIMEEGRIEIEIP